MKRPVAIILAVVVLLGVCLGVKPIIRKITSDITMHLYVNQVRDTVAQYSEFSAEYEVDSDWLDALDSPYYNLTVNVSGDSNPNYGDLFAIIDEVTNLDGYAYEVYCIVEYCYNGKPCELRDGYRLCINEKEVYNAIAAKNGANLTTAEKKLVCEWIFDQYDYYDGKEGEHTGDKYSDKIFAGASEYFSTDIQDLEIIWMNYYSY